MFTHVQLCALTFFGMGVGYARYTRYVAEVKSGKNYVLGVLVFDGNFSYIGSREIRSDAGRK